MGSIYVIQIKDGNKFKYYNRRQKVFHPFFYQASNYSLKAAEKALAILSKENPNAEIQEVMFLDLPCFL